MGRIVYIPRIKKHNYPEVDAGGYPAGSVWQSDDGSRWLSVWDPAKKEYVWAYIDPFGDLNVGARLSLTYTFEPEED